MISKDNKIFKFQSKNLFSADELRRKTMNLKYAKLYYIASPHTDKRYYGSTCKKYLCDRLGQHTYEYRSYKSGKRKLYYSAFEVLKHGDAYIRLVRKVKVTDKAELKRAEQALIDKHIDIAVNIHRAYISPELAEERKREYNKVYRKEKKAELKASRIKLREL